MKKYLLYIIAALFILMPLSFADQALENSDEWAGENAVSEPATTGVGMIMTSYNDGEWEFNIKEATHDIVFDSTPFILTGYSKALIQIGCTTAANATGAINQRAADADNDGAGTGGQKIMLIGGFFGRSISSASNRGVAMPVFDSTTPFNSIRPDAMIADDTGIISSVSAQLHMPTLGVYRADISGLKWGKMRYSTGAVNGAVKACTIWVKAYN